MFGRALKMSREYILPTIGKRPFLKLLSVAMSVLNTSTSQLAILSGFAGLIMFLAYQASQEQTAVTFVIPPAQEAPSNRKAVESIISEKKEEEEVTAPETAG